MDKSSVTTLLERLSNARVGYDGTRVALPAYGERGAEFSLKNLIQEWMIFRGNASVKNSDLHADNILDGIVRQLENPDGNY